MPRTLKSRKVLWIATVIALCVVVLAMSYTAMLSVKVENTQTNYTVNDVNSLQEQLKGNVSQLSSLSAQISKLNEEIAQLRSTATHMNSENLGLKQQNSELNSVIEQIDQQIKIDEAIEHIRDTVYAMQNPPTNLP